MIRVKEYCILGGLIIGGEGGVQTNVGIAPQMVYGTQVQLSACPDLQTAEEIIKLNIAKASETTNSVADVIPDTSVLISNKLDEILV